MRESEVDRRLSKLERKLENQEFGGSAGSEKSLEELENEMNERLEELEDEDVSQEIQTLKMQVGKLRSRIQDLEEYLEDDE